MNLRRLQGELQRLGVRVIVQGREHTWRGEEPEERFGGLLPYFDWEGKDSLVSWTNRTVLVDDRFLSQFKARLIHEIVHALYSSPPQDMPEEHHTWMFPFERHLARVLGEEENWEYYQRGMYLNRRPNMELRESCSYGHLTPTERRAWYSYWLGFAREEDLILHNHFRTPPCWKGQHTPSPGLYRVEEREEVWRLYDFFTDKPLR